MISKTRFGFGSGRAEKQGLRERVVHVVDIYVAVVLSTPNELNFA
jgi:hypothetical protein